MHSSIQWRLFTSLGEASPCPPACVTSHISMASLNWTLYFNTPVIRPPDESCLQSCWPKPFTYRVLSQLVLTWFFCIIFDAAFWCIYHYSSLSATFFSYLLYFLISSGILVHSVTELYIELLVHCAACTLFLSLLSLDGGDCCFWWWRDNNATLHFFLLDLLFNTW